MSEMALENAPDQSQAASAPWWQVWRDVFFHPSVETQERLIADPKAGAGRALLWMFLGSLAAFGLLTLFIGALILLIWLTPGMLDKDTLLPMISILIGVLVFEMLLYASVNVIWLVIAGGIPHLIAMILGGRGAFSKTMFLFGAILTPVSILNAIPFLSVAALPLGMYGVYLQVAAVRAVHRLTWTKSATAVLTPIIVAVLAVVTFYILYFAFMVWMLLYFGGQNPGHFQNMMSSMLPY